MNDNFKIINAKPTTRAYKRTYTQLYIYTHNYKHTNIYLHTIFHTHTIIHTQNTHNHHKHTRAEVNNTHLRWSFAPSRGCSSRTTAAIATHRSSIGTRLYAVNCAWFCGRDSMASVAAASRRGRETMVTTPRCAGDGVGA